MKSFLTYHSTQNRTTSNVGSVLLRMKTFLDPNN